jgi:hypothetical protein
VRAERKGGLDPYRFDPYASVSSEWYQLPVTTVTSARSLHNCSNLLLTTDINHMDWIHGSDQDRRYETRIPALFGRFGK